MEKVLETTNNIILEEKVKQKRGRKPKTDKPIIKTDLENISISIQTPIEIVKDKKGKNVSKKESNLDEKENQLSGKNDEQKAIKKRGRKPKGGKIIQQPLTITDNKNIIPNIILHLKCSLNDLDNNDFNKKIESFDFTSNKKELNYDVISDYTNDTNDTSELLNSKMDNDINDYKTFIHVNTNNTNNNNNNNNNINTEESSNENECSNKKNMRFIWSKLKELEQNLHTNNICDKKSACFWCTYDFDNPPIYIPKYFIKESYNVYGCFCTPECAVAYLMEENIDHSSKFERYFLLNHIYSKVFNYTKNIKPAPNAKFMLEKYYGNLTIQEYRALFKNDRLFLIVDKPLTRILPELHEDNDDFIINNKVIPSNTYQIIKNQKKQSKNNIINEKFGIS